MIRILIAISFLGSSAFAANICSQLNSCVVKKTTFGNHGWKTDYTKELSPKNLCAQQSDSSHNLQLEDELGITLQVFDGDPKATNPIERKPWILADLYTYKPTFVVANAKSAIDSTTLSFSHRLTPKGSSLVEVSCYVK